MTKRRTKKAPGHCKAAYIEKRAEVNALMDRLEKLLVEEDAKFEASGSVSYGYVGDLDYVRKQVESAVKFLANEQE